ncbi:MAG: hypothetical protein K0R00_91 [Herbinix sp.]|jgi:hypothetical protein|nr:hypothetical protein [Herbinix sp.]
MNECDFDILLLELINKGILQLVKNMDDCTISDVHHKDLGHFVIRTSEEEVYYLSVKKSAGAISNRLVINTRNVIVPSVAADTGYNDAATTTATITTTATTKNKACQPPVF